MVAPQYGGTWWCSGNHVPDLVIITFRKLDTYRLTQRQNEEKSLPSICGSNRARNKVFLVRFQFLQDKILFTYMLLQVFEKHYKANSCYWQKEREIRKHVMMPRSRMSKGRETFGKKVEENSINLKLVSAIFYQIFISSSNDSPSKTVKNVFYFI